MIKKSIKLMTGSLFLAALILAVKPPVAVFADDEEEEEIEEVVEEEPEEEKKEEDPDGSISIDLRHGWVREGGVTGVSVDVDADGDYYIDWHSSDSSVGIIDGSGDGIDVIGRSSGATDIIATLYVDGREVDSASVTLNVGRGDRNHHHHHDDDDKHKHRNRDYVYVNGVTLNTNNLIIYSGLSARLYAGTLPSYANDKRVVFASTNPLVASVDADGTVHGLTPGVAMIAASAVEGGYTAYAFVTVVAPTGEMAALTSQISQALSRDPGFLYQTVNRVLTAPLFGTVSIPSSTPMSFDVNVANAMKVRPDVTILVSFPYQGHMYCMAVPAGYDLAARLKGGYADWTSLMKASGIVLATLY